MSRALVVGLGHPDRGDDAIGPEVARAVRALGLPGVDVVEGTEPIQLLGLWEGYPRVVLVDAVQAHGPVGTVWARDAVAEPLPSHAGTASSHALDLAGVLQLARTMGRLPAGVVLVGVVGTRFGVGEPMSDEVRRGLDDAVRAVVSVVGAEASLS